MAEKRQKPSPLVLVACLVGLLGGGGLAVLSTVALTNTMRLQRQGVRTEARVTDARWMRQGSREYFEVRYAFEVPGRPGTFTLGDELTLWFGSSNLWATTDGRGHWDAARETGRVMVQYLPEDPRHNQLVRAHGMPVGDSTVLVFLALMVAAPSVWIGWLEARGQGERWRAIVAAVQAAMRPGR
jgi:hypothetical protein